MVVAYYKDGTIVPVDVEDIKVSEVEAVVVLDELTLAETAILVRGEVKIFESIEDLMKACDY